MIVSSVKWIESAGGPLVAVPGALASCWNGVSSDDYELACGTDKYLDLIQRAWGQVLVLGDAPLRTAVVQREDGPAILRWMYAPSEGSLLEAALSVKLGPLEPLETLRAKFRDEDYLIFDSGAVGSGTPSLVLSVPHGTNSVKTYIVKDESMEIGMILHCFSP